MSQVSAENNIVVRGKPFPKLPEDLYIPPDALEVFLEAFEGPLDLLLYLIKKQNIDILDIPIAEITHQYMQYVELMKELHLELAAEYLVMAGTLAEIKSRMLLPKPSDVDEEADPRAELIRRLQEYERYKKVAEKIDGLSRINREIFLVAANFPEDRKQRTLPHVDLQDLWFALRGVLLRASMYEEHLVKKEKLSVREKMTYILNQVKAGSFVDFIDLFDAKEGRMGIIITFTALLELLKQTMIEVVQTENFGVIHVTKR